MSVAGNSPPVTAPNPTVAAAESKVQADSIIMSAVQSGDSAADSMLDTVYGQAEAAQALLSALVPSLGPNVDTRA